MHTHSWKYNEWYSEDGGFPVHCRGPKCPASLDWKEILCRLNAVEMLPAKFAVEIAMGIEESGLGRVTSDAPPLRAYAKVLEGE